MLAKGDGHFDFAYFGYAQHGAVTWVGVVILIWQCQKGWGVSIIFG